MTLSEFTNLWSTLKNNINEMYGYEQESLGRLVVWGSLKRQAQEQGDTERVQFIENEILPILREQRRYASKLRELLDSYVPDWVNQEIQAGQATQGVQGLGQGLGAIPLLILSGSAVTALVSVYAIYQYYQLENEALSQVLQGFNNGTLSAEQGKVILEGAKNSKPSVIEGLTDIMQMTLVGALALGGFMLYMRLK